MRKIAIALLTLSLAAILASPAAAVVLMAEQFPYPDGNLAGNGGWLTHSGAGTDIQVVSGRANGLMTNAPDDNLSFPAQSATAKSYACFHVVIPAPASLPVVTNYFAHLKDTGTFNLGARVYVLPVGNEFTFGVSLGSCASPCAPATWPVTLSYDTEYTVAIDYDAGLGVAELWVNPVTEADPKITHNTWSGTFSQVGFQISAFALRQSSSGIPSGVSNWRYQVDNIGVADNFDEACASGPTPTRDGTWGHLKTIYR